MENTVTISLKEYNELRDFKKEVEGGKIAVIRTGAFVTTIVLHRFYTRDEVITELTERINQLEDERAVQFKKIVTEIQNNRTIKQELMKDFQRMSLWDFRRWKKEG